MSHEDKPSELYQLSMELRSATTQAAIERAYDKIKAYVDKHAGWEAHTGSVSERFWEPGDTYLTVEVQVSEETFKRGQEVEILIRPKA